MKFEDKIKYTFEGQLEVGARGEDIAVKIFKDCWENCRYEDVSKDKEFQNDDVDFLVDIDGRMIKIEVKNDTQAHKTGNLCYERYSCFQRKTLGGFEKTTADYILYIIEGSKTAYLIHTNSLRDYIHNNEDTLKKVYPNTTHKEAKFKYNSLCYLVKFDLLQKQLGSKMKKKDISHLL